MRVTCLVLVCLAFVLAVESGCLVSRALCGGKHVIPIEVRQDVTLVTVKIGDVVIPHIVLDTGMPFDGVMIYDPTYKDSLDLSGAFEVRVGGAGGGDAATALMIDSASFWLGDLYMKNQRILLLQDDIYTGFPTNGVTGYSIFGHYPTELDYDRKTMTLHDPHRFEAGYGWTAIPIYFKDNNIPWVDASVVIAKGKPVQLSTYIDYASSDAIELLEKPGMKFRLPKVTEESHLGTGLSGDIHGKRGRISKLIIGPFELSDINAAIAPAEIRSKQDNADAVLGGAALSRFNLIFDYSGKTLYLRPNSRFGEPFE